jgi:hypothetical protein
VKLLQDWPDVAAGVMDCDVHDPSRDGITALGSSTLVERLWFALQPAAIHPIATSTRHTPRNVFIALRLSTDTLRLYVLIG